MLLGMINFSQNKKKILIWMGSVLLILAVLMLGIVLYLKKISPPAPSSTTSPISQETQNLNPELDKQLKELDELKNQFNPNPFTEKATNEQIKTLNSLHQKINPQTLSLEQIQKQLEELDKLRSK